MIKNIPVQCPHCESEFTLDDAISAQLKKQFELDGQSKFHELTKKLSEKELYLDNQLKKINKMKEETEKEVQQKLEIEKSKLEIKIKNDIEKQKSIEIEDLRNQNLEKEQIVNEARKKELDLLKKMRVIEDREKSLELEVIRQVDEQTKLIEEELKKRNQETIKLNLLDKDKQIEDMKKIIEELNRKSEVASQQAKGEVMELDLETTLVSCFPLDKILPVPKGIKGADCIQEVVSSSGQTCGKIAWETKRTKNWSDSWIPKIKSDQQAAGADFSVLVTLTMPKDSNGYIKYVDGVWVVDISSFQTIAAFLRAQIIQVHQIRSLSLGQGERIESLYQYLSGPVFHQRMESIVSTISKMRSDLEHEKRSYEKIWATRDTQISKLMRSSSAFYGELQAITGSQLALIPALELLVEITEKSNGEK
jgi:hypothetical protein